MNGRIQMWKQLFVIQQKYTWNWIEIIKIQKKQLIRKTLLQLNYLGAVVMERSIIKTKKYDFKKEEFQAVLDEFYNKIT